MKGRNRIQGALVLLISLMLWLGVGPVLSLLYLSWPRSGEGWLSVLQGYITVHIPFIALFLGLTAYDTQKIKDLHAYYGHDPEMAAKASVFAALQLYLDFINLFLYLLRFLGRRRD